MSVLAAASQMFLPGDIGHTVLSLHLKCTDQIYLVCVEMSHKYLALHATCAPKDQWALCEQVSIADRQSDLYRSLLACTKIKSRQRTVERREKVETVNGLANQPILLYTHIHHIQVNYGPQCIWLDAYELD